MEYCNGRPLELGQRKQQIARHAARAGTQLDHFIAGAEQELARPAVPRSG